MLHPQLKLKFAGPCAQGVLDPVISLVLWAVLGSKSVVLGGSLRILVAGRSFFFTENPRMKMGSAARERTKAPHGANLGQTWGNLGPTWVNLGPTRDNFGQLKTNLALTRAILGPILCDFV